MVEIAELFDDGDSPLPLRRASSSESGAWHSFVHKVSTRREAVSTLLRNYWSEILSNPRSRRPPFATLLYVGALVGVYAGVPGHGIWYDPRGGPWWSALGAMCSHVDAEHLVANVCMLLLLGRFLEFTEGFRHVLAVVWAGGLLGCALHGAARPSVRVRGASGAAYAVMWAQLALLALNWSEMPARWVRLSLCVLFFGVDVGVYWFDRQPGLSYSAHLGGAAAGVAAALVLGRNVRPRRRDLPLGYAGVATYAALVGIGLGWRQTAPSALAAALLPVLALRTAWHTRRALRPASHPPKEGEGRTTTHAPTRVQRAHARETSRLTRGKQLLRHGTHLVLASIALRVPRAKRSQPAGERDRPDPRRARAKPIKGKQKHIKPAGAAAAPPVQV